MGALESVRLWLQGGQAVDRTAVADGWGGRHTGMPDHAALSRWWVWAGFGTVGELFLARIPTGRRSRLCGWGLGGWGCARFARRTGSTGGWDGVALLSCGCLGVRCECAVAMGGDGRVFGGGAGGVG